MSQAEPPVCQLSHPAFHMLGEPVFRLSEGSGVPSMVILLESQEAVLPLRALAREFKVDPASPDGQMLDQIEKSLDFVVALKLGQKLPPEATAAEPTFEPNGQDRLIAFSRVRQNLVRGVFARLGKKAAIQGDGAPGWELMPKNRELLQEAIDAAAAMIDGIEAAEIAARVAAIGEEVACIESMRRSLTRGITNMRDKLLRVQMEQAPADRQETVRHVQGLARRGLTEITSRFDGVDLRLDDVLAMLRDPTGAIGWLRAQRDWLFRTNQAWGPVFADWNGAPHQFDDFLWKVVQRSYQFLAPRFMAFQEWISAEAKLQKEQTRAQVW